MLQPQPSWQVISNWVVPNATESVHVAVFPSYEEARAAVAQLAQQVGAMINGRLLKGIQMAGDFREVWDRGGC